jgi:REP element-mobilizing transposase RayT
MSNHYHLLVETPDGNLAKGMRELNGVYTQRFNRIHQRVRASAHKLSLKRSVTARLRETVLGVSHVCKSA